MAMPMNPLSKCSKAPSPNDPFCRMEWRIERVDGSLVSRTINRMPDADERLVQRCCRCHKEAK